MSKIEILAPVGNEEMLRAAVFSGADAVYLGFSGFNARTSANNFNADTLKDAVAFCHARGVAVHVALNTTVYGGELPALILADAISRMLPGVLANEDAFTLESHYGSLLEYPQYTRPPEFMGKKVPDVLLSGNHKLINEWRLEQSITRTKEHRPDMYEKYMIENPPKEKKKRRK